jgi:hypothetical protein
MQGLEQQSHSATASDDSKKDGLTLFRIRQNLEMRQKYSHELSFG